MLLNPVVGGVVFSLNRVRGLYRIACGVAFCSVLFGCVFVANCCCSVSGVAVPFLILNAVLLSTFAVVWAICYLVLVLKSVRCAILGSDSSVALKLFCWDWTLCS